jgi:hypothetical protein
VYLILYLQVYTTPIYVAFPPNGTSGSDYDYEVVGTAYIFFMGQRNMRITAALSCPWMMWSSPTNMDTVS